MKRLLHALPERVRPRIPMAARGRPWAAGQGGLRTVPVLSVGAILLSGCAYFNGMYYANRYQSLAEASERAGRIAEARQRWQEAAQHAESLTTRHPNSHWVPDALLVRGRAQVHLEYWNLAVTVLEEAERRASSPEQRREALGLLGRAYLAINRYPQAMEALDSAVESARAATREAALLDRGRVWIALKQPDSAAADFARSAHPHARYDLARAELLLRDTAAAAALYDSLAAVGAYAESDWRAALDSLAAAGARGRASQLVDSLAGRRDLTAGQLARLLLDDGDRRLTASDTAGAASRFAMAVTTGRDSAEASVASVRLARLAIAAATSDSDLAAVRGRLQGVSQRGGAAGRDAETLVRQLAEVEQLAAAATAPDAFWFWRAEVLRDSLHAGTLAAIDYGEMAARFPDSPWTPKGLVAAIAAGHPAADSLRALLLGRYGRSPYAVVAAGRSGEDSAYAALEDSLRQALVRRAPSGRAAGADARNAADDEPSSQRGRERPARPQQPPAPSPRPDTGPPRPGDLRP